jgi:hypothetical protein
MPATIKALICSALAVAALAFSPPAAAQSPTAFMQRLAGPFAGRVAQNGQMAPLYGSQAGARPHLLQGTQALAMVGNDPEAPIRAMRMATSAEPPDRSSEGSAKRPEAPDVDVGERPWDVFVGSCAGGAFIGGFSAISATGPAGATPIGLTVVATSTGIGCGIGVATAVVSLGAVYTWRFASR